MKQLSMTLMFLVASCSLSWGADDDLELQYRRNDGTTVNYKGRVRESARGLELLSGSTKGLHVAPSDVLRADYFSGVIPDTSDAKINEAADEKRLREGGPSKNREFYAALNERHGPDTDKSRRVLSFREAYWATRDLDRKLGKEFDDAAPEVAALWDKIIDNFSETWESQYAYRRQARIALERSDFDGAVKVLRRAAESKELTGEQRYELLLDAAALQLHSRSSYTLVETIIASIEKEDRATAQKSNKMTPSMKQRIEVMKVAVKLRVMERPAIGTSPPKEELDKLRAEIAIANDPIAQACGHNVLGEIYTLYGLHSEAAWSHLSAAYVQGEDELETLLALRRLEILTPRIKGFPDCRDRYREKILQIRR